MDRQAALQIVTESLNSVFPDFPTPLNPDAFLMADLKLESVDLLNLLVEIERRLKTRVDLMEIMRQREGTQAYNRDIKVGDLIQFIYKYDSP